MVNEGSIVPQIFKYITFPSSMFSTSQQASERAERRGASSIGLDSARLCQLQRTCSLKKQSLFLCFDAILQRNDNLTMGGYWARHPISDHREAVQQLLRCGCALGKPTLCVCEEKRVACMPVLKSATRTTLRYSSLNLGI